MSSRGVYTPILNVFQLLPQGVRSLGYHSPPASLLPALMLQLCLISAEHLAFPSPEMSLPGRNEHKPTQVTVLAVTFPCTGTDPDTAFPGCCTSISWKCHCCWSVTAKKEEGWGTGTNRDVIKGNQAGSVT